MSGVFTIAPGAPFAEYLARGLLERLKGDAAALAGVTIYLPTRRAARGFGDAFAQVLGGAALLPQFKPLGDSDDDDLLFDAAAEDIELQDAIAPLRRQLLLARLIREWDEKGRDGALSFAQCTALAASLARVMDEVDTQGCDLGKLKDLAPEHLAEHWEGVARFLSIIRDEWPAILDEERALNPAKRRNLALTALAKRLESAPPEGMVIAAGSTGSIPATRELLKAIAGLPNGAVVLPGLDQGLDEESWSRLDPGHPQYGLHELLRAMDAERVDVKDWFGARDDSPRAALLRETLRPAPTTDAWRALAAAGGGAMASGLDGLALAECADAGEEALAIALALRESLERPGSRAALVTPDRSLARRVAAELARWDILIDDSAGKPLAHTAAGSFLCLLAEAVQACFAPVPLLALLKHPFARGGEDAAGFRARARELDRWCLRGPRPDAGLAGVASAIARAGQAHRPPPGEALARLAVWWEDVARMLAPLEKLCAHKTAPLRDLCAALVAAADALTRDEKGDVLLWRDRDGEAAAALMAGLDTAAEGLPPIEPGSFAAMLRGFAMAVPVRTPFGHPQLAILGPLEARLQSFDLVVLGGLNEGVWPAAAGHDPWFSRPMRTTLGLEQPERGIGLAAHDFAGFAAGPRVLMTRAQKADGAPTTPSRWLQRLQQLTRGLGLELPQAPYARLAAQLGEVAAGEKLARPAPRPPLEARPRGLSVTEIETWLRDPYAIYARHVLKLRPLDALDEAVGPLERGTALHSALEVFVNRFPDALPDDAVEQLTAIADAAFAEAGVPKSTLALWRPRFLRAAEWFVALERRRRAAIARSVTEIKGSRVFAHANGEFTLSGIADRIDVMKDGGAAILDYKTGKPPSHDQIETLIAPQLLLEAAILMAGGFPGIEPRHASELLYLQLSGGLDGGREQAVKDPDSLTAQAIEKLAQRIRFFHESRAPYTSRVMPFSTDSMGDYDHLARVREWSAIAEDG